MHNVSSNCFNAQILELLPPRLLSHKGTACLPDGLQILSGTSSRIRSLASLPHRPTDKTSCQACFPPDTACCRCLSSRPPRSEIEPASSSANPYPHGKECTIHNFHADKTSWSAEQT